jgi:hypothetical protein
MSQFHSFRVPLAVLASSAGLAAAADGPPDPADEHAASAAEATMPSALSRIASRGSPPRRSRRLAMLSSVCHCDHFL